MAGSGCIDPCSLRSNTDSRPSNLLPALCILTPGGPNKAIWPFDWLCELIFAFTWTCLKNTAILLTARHICHLVVAIPIAMVRRIFLVRFDLRSSNSRHNSHTVERWACFRSLGRIPSFLRWPSSTALVAVSVENAGVVHVSPKSHERRPPNRSFRQSRTEGVVSHSSSQSLDGACWPHRPYTIGPCNPSLS
jgi:hypothetical protein